MPKDTKNKREKADRADRPVVVCDDYTVEVACVHCGAPFKQWESTGGEFGICQSCID